MKGEFAVKMERMGYMMTEYGANMIQALVILVIGLLLLQFVMRKIKALMDKKEKDHSRATTILSIVYILSFIIIVSAALITVGFDSHNLLRLIIMTGLVAIVILILLRPYFPKLPFKVGNTVKVGSLFGKIESITMVHTRMKTFDGKTVYIPNSKILNDFVINYHYTPTRRIKIDIHIRYIRDILKSKQILESIMIEDPRVLLKPGRPVVYVLNLVEGCVKLGARCWVDNAKFWLAKCDLLEKMLHFLDREKITLAGRWQVIRLFHETPLQVSDEGAALTSDMQEASEAQGKAEQRFEAVNDDEEI